MLRRHMQATYLSGRHQDADLFNAGRAAGGGEAAGGAGDRPPLPLHMPNQGVVLLNKANRQLQLRSEVPAVRILGFFAPNASVAQHTTRLAAHDIDIYQAASFSYTLVPQKAYTDPEVELAAVNAIIADHQRMLEDRKQQFDTNVKEHKMGDTTPAPTPPDAIAEDASEAHSASGRGDLPGVEAIQLDQEVRGQKFAVVSVLRHDTEPAVCAFGAFETEDLARHYIAATLSKHIRDHHLDVVPMYQWLHLDTRTMDDDRVPRLYRNRQLDEIMRTKRAQHQQVEHYMKHCEEIGEKPKFRDIDLDAPAVEDTTEDTQDTGPEKTEVEG